MEMGTTITYSLGNINDRSFSVLVVFSLLLGFFGNKRPETLDVDGWAVVSVA